MSRFYPLFFTLLSAVLLNANESKVCKQCHPVIYDEYYKSSHRNSSVFNNPIHNAMWQAHPKVQEGYTCAKCHSPSDKEALQKGILTSNETQIHEPISCVYCHSIKDVQEGDGSNANVIHNKAREFFTAQEGKEGKATYKKEVSWFGLKKEPKSSPFHKIDYDNKNYYSGNVCMGCHSHTNNEHGLDIIMLDALISDKDKNSCVTCHMPQVPGTKVTINETKTHAYHGIAAIHQNTQMMGEHIDFKVSKANGGFNVELVNRANHALFGQAFRQGVLKAEIKRGGSVIELEPFVFERILAKDGADAMPWEADEIKKDTLIYAKKTVAFDESLKSGDRLTLTLGVQRISKDGAKKLGLESNKELTKFKVLKIETFDF